MVRRRGFLTPSLFRSVKESNLEAIETEYTRLRDNYALELRQMIAEFEFIAL